MMDIAKERSTPQMAAHQQQQQQQQQQAKPNQVGTVLLYGVPIVSLLIESQERLCLAQISNTLLKEFSYNEIHNRRVALGITCVQCTPVQLEILRRAGAMPVSSRRCGMITRREAERLCKSFLGDNAPPRLPEDFAFAVHHECAWGCRGAFLPARYNSSRAKCIKCAMCGLFFSPNKFIFHSHRSGPTAKYVQPDAANFNSWRRHLRLSGSPPEEVVHAWEDVKAMFNGGTRKRLMASSSSSSSSSSGSSASSGSSPACKQPKLESAPASNGAAAAASAASSAPAAAAASVFATPAPAPARVPPFPDLPLPLSRSLVMDYVWHQKQQHFAFPPYAAALPWLAGAKLAFPPPPPPPPPPPAALAHADLQPKAPYQSAFRPVLPAAAAVAAGVATVAPPQASTPAAIVAAENLAEAPVNDAPSPVGVATSADDDDDDETLVDIESTEDEPPPAPAPAAPAAPAPRLWKTASPKVEEEIPEQQESQAGGEGEAAPRPGLWAVARLSLEHPERALYRSEVARQLHLMRELAAPVPTEPCAYFGLPDALHAPDRIKEAHTALQHLSSKMALDCSACHQLYSGAVLPAHSPDAKLAP